MIGLSGAHRSGKSTLAEAWHRHMTEMGAEVEHVRVDTAGVIARFNLECGDINDVATRIDVQRAIADHYHELFNGRRTPFVSDRTPLDVAAYMLADLGQQPLPDALETRALEIVEDCIDIANACFGIILLLPPVLPYKPAPGKPPANKAYQQHFHMLMQGLINDPRLDVPAGAWLLNERLHKLEDRVDVMDKLWGAMIENDTHIAEVAVLQ